MEDELRPNPQEFFIGDIVRVINGTWAKDWENEELIIGEVYWNPKKNQITYGTYPTKAPTSEGMTDEWQKNDLQIVKQSFQLYSNGI